ncbi:citrate synthase-lysine N-methyltransferase CSKMT, mitochondrial isoform X2 [Leopardus geoffroyi]|uniref:citrate synthase-lysine N-methyltransferase CSKMT, mitochondrial isoform X2 n=1 Tax=Leopardus geoffroyi TaxID=46844 RepID=UPI001E261222|nr:citrate synthase-lysine N-methyltransferase CSKMT, mitochondrial isoform X2 [Leopardus geoffroyi]
MVVIRLFALSHKAEFATFLLDLRLLRECGRHFAEGSLADLAGISRWPRCEQLSTWRPWRLGRAELCWQSDETWALGDTCAPLVSTGSLAGNCLAHRRLWDKLHSGPRVGSVPTFDWFFGYEEAQGFLLPLLQEARAAYPLRVLDVGCGTSSLCTGLYTKCPIPVDVLGVDFSPVAVAHMNSLLEGGQDQIPLYPGHPASRLQFIQADAQNLEPVAPSGSFQLVLDKGTWDAVARGGLPGAYQLLSECLRVLSPRGTLIQFSDEDPDVRLPCLEQGSQGWTVTVQELGPFRGIPYFAYLVQVSH